MHDQGRDDTTNSGVCSTGLRLVEALPAGTTGSVLGRQLLRCGTSVGANYRAACRAKSKADFINKLKIVEEECDETIYWMELIVAAKLVPNSKVRLLFQEANELLSIVVAAIRTSRANRKS
ncbi:MAG: four helix bundle protein [Opitutaceae bacterium]